MSEIMADMAEKLKQTLSELPIPEKTPEELALEKVKEEMGQYYGPHVRQGINIYIAELAIQRALQGEQ